MPKENKLQKNKSRARNGNGHLRQRKDGLWELQYQINGKNGSLYGHDKDEVEKKFIILKHQIYTGVITQLDKIKYGDWFEIWLSSYKAVQLKPKTLHSYRELYDLYIRDSHLANINIQDLTVNSLQLFINNLSKTSLSARTINYTKTVISGSLDQALKCGYISKNYAKSITSPKKSKKEIRVLTVEEQKDFINALNGHRYQFLFSFDLNTGLRTGELLGLQWRDIDFHKKLLYVRRSLNALSDDNGKLTLSYGTTKTEYSTRCIPLSDELISNLQKHKELQKKEMKDAGDFWLGKEGVHFNENNIFSTDKGSPIYPSTLRHLIDRIINKINNNRLENASDLNDVTLMAHFSMHTLRHTFATRALESNVPAKVVSEILGHSTVSITLDIYSHVLPDTKQHFMDQIIDVAPFKY